MRALVRVSVFLFLSLHAVLCTMRLRDITGLRGGWVPAAKENGEYYEQYHLDYGTEDNRRIAGSLRGLIKAGSLTNLPQSDAFLKWLQSHMEEGPQLASGRVKAYHATDFGTKADLKAGEHPKLIIVNRKLIGDKDGAVGEPPAEVDVEVRTIWQPWLKSKCNFAVRYIVPNRVNIIQIMESQNRFTTEFHVERDSSPEKVGKNNDREQTKAWISMTFKPTLLDRLRGKRDVVLKHQVDASKILK